MRANDPWPQERVERLKALNAEGLSAGRIAQELGVVTRNAVIGKLKRMKIALASARSEARRQRATSPRPRPPAPRPEQVSITCDEPPSLAIPIAETREGQCRWIASEPTAECTCCGHKTRRGSSYCEFHHARCWAPAPKRQSGGGFAIRKPGSFTRILDPDCEAA
jgi:GcrA cell cycle regulator